MSIAEILHEKYLKMFLNKSLKNKNQLKMKYFHLLDIKRRHIFISKDHSKFIFIFLKIILFSIYKVEFKI